MIRMDFDQELDEIRDILQIDANSEQMTQLIVLCVKLFDRGMLFERERIINIIKNLAMDHMSIETEIRKSTR